MLGKNSIPRPVEASALTAGKGPEIPASASANASRNTKPAKEWPRVWCDYCDKPQHTQENRWKLHGKTASFKGNRPGDKAIPTGNMAETGSLSKKQLNQIIQLLKSN